MHWIDWLIIIPYILGMLVIGLLLRKKATASVDDYFLAGRKLPWWLIGFTNVASYTGSSAAFVLLVFQNGIVGNWLWWGIWVIWMPMMTIFWAKIWRRLRIITDAEFLELRYGGNFAKILRMTVAIYASFFFAVIGMAMVSTWLSATVAAITGISANWLIVIFAIITFIYTLLSGLLGISYTDIPQFLIYVVANVILVPFCIAAAGGWSTMYETVAEVRGIDFFQPVPPTVSIPTLTIMAFLLQGFLTTAQSSTAQRFAAARNEFHAIMGQALATVLSLVVRIAPLILVGIAAAAIFPADHEDPGSLYGAMILLCAPVGLVGLLIVSELSGYMSTMDTLMNWGASLFVNDIYRRFLHKGASENHYVKIGQAATALMTLIAILVAVFFVNATQEWFLYLNSVIGVFAITAGVLRFIWWRFNKYSEFAGLAGAFPLGAFVWFILGFKDRPFWQAFALLAFSGLALMVLVSFLTPPENTDKLRRFYKRCLPFGFWGPIRQQVVLDDYSKGLVNYKADFFDAVLSILFSLLLVISANSLFGLWFKTSLACLAGCIVTGYALVTRWKKRGFLSGLQEEEVILAREDFEAVSSE